MTLGAKPEKPKMRIITETFRDKVTAGAHEQWRLRTVDADGRGVPAALALNMYDTRILTFYSMNTLRPALADYGYRRDLDVDIPYYNMYGFGASVKPKLSDVLTLDLPRWVYDTPRFIPRGVGNRMYGASKRENSLEEEECYELAGDIAGVQMANAAEAPALLEQIVVAYGIDSRAAETPRESVLSQVEFRKDDVLNALWLPTLTTDRDGYADVKVDIPATPSTWHFTATAWTTDMRTASIKQTVIAIKPLIVKAVVPQFIRRGDRAEFLSNITNNTEASACISAVAEVFDVKPTRYWIHGNSTSTWPPEPRASSLWKYLRV